MWVKDVINFLYKDDLLIIYLMVLSFIIPAFNVEAYIGRCLDSILCQDMSDFEVLVVDDGSTDSTSLICQEYVRHDSRVKYFHQENQGVSSARNLGIDLCSGDYLWFVDADDYISHTSLTEILTPLLSNDLDMLQFGWNVVTSDNCMQREIKGVNTDVFSGNDYVGRGYFLGTASRSVIKKSLVFREIYFDRALRIGEDSFFMTQVLSKCERVKQIEVAPYNYYQNCTSTTYNIPFEGCILVARRMMALQLDRSFFEYQSNFIAFYLSLAFFSKEFNSNQLICFANSNNVLSSTLFVKKVLQNLLSYRYGFFRVKAPKHERLLSLIRIRSFFYLLRVQNRICLSCLALFVLPLSILDFCFSGLSRMLRLFYISNK